MTILKTIVATAVITLAAATVALGGAGRVLGVEGTPSQTTARDGAAIALTDTQFAALLARVHDGDDAARDRDRAKANDRVVRRDRERDRDHHAAKDGERAKTRERERDAQHQSTRTQQASDSGARQTTHHVERDGISGSSGSGGSGSWSGGHAGGDHDGGGHDGGHGGGH
jgi:hypothetical protein